MLKLHEFLQPINVLCNVQVRSKKHALEILSELIVRGHETEAAADQIFVALVGRERLGCTGLGHSIAVPHARIEGLDHALGAFIKLSEPIDFDTSDNIPVDLILACVIPADAGDTAVDEFQAITSKLSTPECQAQLRAARTSHELYELLVHPTDPMPSHAVVAGGR